MSQNALNVPDLDSLTFQKEKYQVLRIDDRIKIATWMLDEYEACSTTKLIFIAMCYFSRVFLQREQRQPTRGGSYMKTNTHVP